MRFAIILLLASSGWASEGGQQTTDLSRLIQNRQFDAFDKLAASAVEGGASVPFTLLHRHFWGFHEVVIAVSSSGIQLEMQRERVHSDENAPLQACLWTDGLLAASRILSVEIVREGSSGVLLRLVVAAGKKLDKRDQLNFAVVGSAVASEEVRH